MKVTLQKLIELEAAFLKVEIPVRYDEEDISNDFPLRFGNVWRGTIELETRKILEWDFGVSGEFYMKVCDEGIYILLDDKGHEIAKIHENHVPQRLLPPNDGCGDYVHFIINADGIITNWYKEPSLLDFEGWRRTR